MIPVHDIGQLGFFGAEALLEDTEDLHLVD